MQKGKRIIYICICTLTLLLLPACGNANISMKDTYAYTFRMAESHPESHPTAQADLEFARRVAEGTDGRIQIIVYFDQELGDEQSVVDQVQFGAIDFTRVSIANIAKIVPDLNVLQMPYLYTDRAHMWRVLDSDIGDEFLTKVGDSGFVGLTWYDGGARSFYTKDKPIETLQDLDGLTIRMMENPLMMSMAKAMGFTGVQASYGDVYSLLQRGDVSGAENNYSSYLASSHYQVARYYTLDEHLRVPEMVIGSQISLSNLSDLDWAVIRKAARETTVYQKQLWSEMEEKAKEQLLNEGVQILELKDRTSFVQAVQPVYDQYEEQYGELIRRIKGK